MIGFMEKNKDDDDDDDDDDETAPFLHNAWFGTSLGNSRGTLATVVSYITSLDILSHTVDIPTLQCSYVRQPFFWCTLSSTLRMSLTL